MVETTNSTSLVEAISSFSAIPGVTTLIWIIQALGLVVMAYIIFMAVKGVLEYKRLSSLKDVKNTLDSIDHTLLRIEKKVENKKKK